MSPRAGNSKVIISALGKVSGYLTSGLVPHSQRWLEYWDRQIFNYMADPEHRRPAVLFPLQAVRAVLQWSDDPASLVGSIPALDEWHYENGDQTTTPA